MVLILPLESALQKIIKSSKKILEKNFGKLCVPNIKKIRECQSKRMTINIDISKGCSQASNTEKGKIPSSRVQFPKTL